jgi:hypothetical protein
MYDVHVFAVVRVLVTDLDAKTPKAASRMALDAVDWETLFLGLEGGKVQHAEFAEEYNGFLVEPKDKIRGVMSDDGEFLRDDGTPEPSETCFKCRQTTRPSVSLELLKSILYRETSCIAYEDVQGLMNVIRREANHERRGMKTALTEEIS